MDIEPDDIANLATAVSLLTTSIIAIILGARMKKPKIPALQRGVRILQVSMLLLGSFLLVHGLYHASYFLGNDLISDDILEPASIMLLLGFSIYVKKFVFIGRSSRHLSPKFVVPDKSTPGIGVRMATIWFAAPILGSFAATMGYNQVPNATINPAEFFSLFGIILATGLFSWMAINNPSPSSLHFQFALITIVWSIAEVPHILMSLGFIQLIGFEAFGTWIHFASMTLIGAFVCYRLLVLQFKHAAKLSLNPAPVSQEAR